MATTREIRRRIRSVQSTAKITRAMEMVAASRMRRAQERSVAARPYADKMRLVLSDLACQPQATEQPHPLMVQRPVNSIAVVHITSNRGLCGGLNANVNRTTMSFILEQEVPVSVVAVGRKGRDFMVRCGQKLSAEFCDIGEPPQLDDVAAIADIVIDDYSSGAVDEVYLSYARFKTTLSQQPVLWRLLPIEQRAYEPGVCVGYIYEPSPELVLAFLLPRFIEMQLYHAVLEATASEHSARMVAMRNATESANDLVEDLTLSYNKARQDMITRELLDITGGAAALE